QRRDEPDDKPDEPGHCSPAPFGCPSSGEATTAHDLRSVGFPGLDGQTVVRHLDPGRELPLCRLVAQLMAEMDQQRPLWLELADDLARLSHAHVRVWSRL